MAGSTLEGEERILLDAFRELLPISSADDYPCAATSRTFPGRGAIDHSEGLPLIRRSDWMQLSRPIPAGSVFLLDTVGELASVYSLASIAFVGGSLVPAGGHNPLEPAQFAVPIVMGPYTENFRGMVAALLEQEAIRVTPPERLYPTLLELLTSPEAQQMGGRARRVFEEQAGASVSCLTAIQKF